jgi:hypothetical protein
MNIAQWQVGRAACVVSLEATAVVGVPALITRGVEPSGRKPETRTPEPARDFS